MAIVALALQEALVQDFDGLIRIAPAAPSAWDFDGSVSVRRNTKVWVQVRKGIPTAVGIEVKTSQPLKVRNPWPGTAVRVTDAGTGKLIRQLSADAVLEFAAKAGVTYCLERAGDAVPGGFAPIDGQPATSAKKLGPVRIGLDRP
jgi:hypothetical protein